MKLHLVVLLKALGPAAWVLQLLNGGGHILQKVSVCCTYGSVSELQIGTLSYRPTTDDR